MRRVHRQDEVALLGAQGRAGLVPGPVEQVAGAAREVARASPRGGPRSRRPWPPTWRAPCARAAAGGLDRGQPLVRALEARRRSPGGTGASASCMAGGVEEHGRASRRRRRSSVPSSVRIRPIARVPLRLVEQLARRMPRSAPRSPRNCSSVRGRRPSPSAKFARSVCSSASAARSLTCSDWRERASRTRVRTTSTLTVTPASWRASRPIRSARSTNAGALLVRPLGERARRAPGRERRGARRRSGPPSTRTARGSGAVGRETMRASMARISRAAVTPSVSRPSGAPDVGRIRSAGPSPGSARAARSSRRRSRGRSGWPNGDRSASQWWRFGSDHRDLGRPRGGARGSPGR